MYTVELEIDGVWAWLDVDGGATSAPTPDPRQALFASAAEADAATIPEGWTRHVRGPGRY